MFTTGHESPNKGRTITTDPIKSPEALAKVRQQLQTTRDRALFEVAIGSALRAGDLVKLTWDDTSDDGITLTLTLLEGKTKKRRVIPLNEAASSALRLWRRECDSPHIYAGQRGALTTASWGRMVKAWCEAAGLEGSFASHTARKSFVRLHHDYLGTSMATLMEVLNHSSERQTLTYMGRMADDVTKAYAARL